MNVVSRPCGHFSPLFVDVRSRALSLHEYTLEQWRSWIIVVAVNKLLKAFTFNDETILSLSSASPQSAKRILHFTISAGSFLPISVSPPLMDALLYLSDSLYMWGEIGEPKHTVPVVDALLRGFIAESTSAIQRSEGASTAQAMWDVLFLKLLIDRWTGPEWSHPLTLLTECIKHIEQVRSSMIVLESTLKIVYCPSSAFSPRSGCIHRYDDYERWCRSEYPPSPVSYSSASPAYIAECQSKSTHTSYCTLATWRGH